MEHEIKSDPVISVSTTAVSSNADLSEEDESDEEDEEYEQYKKEQERKANDKDGLFIVWEHKGGSFADPGDVDDEMDIYTDAELVMEHVNYNKPKKELTLEQLKDMIVGSSISVYKASRSAYDCDYTWKIFKKKVIS